MAKAAKTERQRRIDEVKKKQKGAERRRGVAIVGVAVVISVLLIGAAAFQPLKERFSASKFSDLALEEIGAPADSCDEVTTASATGNAEHRPTGEQLDYPESPPAFGPHWNEFDLAPDPIGRKFYEKDDRPELEALVHNSEHGYNILWYDETVAANEEQVLEIKAMAKQLDGDDENFRLKFKAVPWTKDDGEPFPDGKHVAYTHWSASGEENAEPDPTTGETPQRGIWQYCDAPSGEALKQFMLDYPYTDSPEPNAG